MSRSGYCDEVDQWQLIRWRGAVNSAIRGARGQAFLKEMLAAMDAMPDKRLTQGELEAGGDVCAIGAVGRARGVDMAGVDPEEYEAVAKLFGIAEAMAREIVFINDDYYLREAPEERFARMRKWIEAQIKPSPVQAP